MEPIIQYVYIKTIFQFPHSLNNWRIFLFWTPWQYPPHFVQIAQCYELLSCKLQNTAEQNNEIEVFE